MQNKLKYKFPAPIYARISQLFPDFFFLVDTCCILFDIAGLNTIQLIQNMSEKSPKSRFS
jgi:hypothetical protein